MPRRRLNGPGHAKSPTRASARDAARRFSDVNRVHCGEEVDTARRFTGSDLVELLRSLPDPGKEYLDEVEAVVARQAPAEDRVWRR